MKKISSLILALTYIVGAVSCDVKVNGSSSSDTALVSVEASEQTKLTNHMTEKERSMVKVGKLTVFDHEMNNDEKIVPDDGIYFEIWSSNDWIEYYKHYRENYPDDKSMT
ncbi:MAG: alpha/beta hydrolase, partial [Ruminococcus sp.]|nr:alpha/beta hydrolase [Ruminococcus sp.]